MVVQDHRAVSEHAARATGVRHESPQAFLFVDGVLAWHGSHGAITRAAMEAAPSGGTRRGG